MVARPSAEGSPRRHSRRRLIVAVAALVGIQAAAVGVYIAVEHARTGDGAPPFRAFDRHDGGDGSVDVLYADFTEWTKDDAARVGEIRKGMGWGKK